MDTLEWLFTLLYLLIGKVLVAFWPYWLFYFVAVVGASVFAAKMTGGNAGAAAKKSAFFAVVVFVLFLVAGAFMAISRPW